MGSLKDIIYDFSDIILGFFIVLAIVLVVWWKVADTMTISSSDSISAVSATEQSNSPSVDANALKPSGDIQTGSTVFSEDVIITVDSGASGYSIAKQLTDAGLITSTTDFISKVEEMKAASKLKAGEFTLKKGMALDEIIKVLIGNQKN